MLKAFGSALSNAWRSVKETLRLSTASDWFSYGTTQWGTDWSQASYNKMVKLASRNPVARRAIDFIGENLANIELKVQKVDDEGETEDLGEHPILELLRKPAGPSNYRYTKEWLFKGMVWAMMGGGEYWLRSISPEGGLNQGQPRMLKLYDQSDFMDFKTDQDGFVSGYRLREERPNHMSKTVEGDTEEILHAFNYNPKNKFRGLAILYSVLRQLDMIEDADEWNKAISQSKGQVPGFFQPEGLDPTQTLNPDTRRQAQEQIDEHINNSRKGNKWHVLSGAYKPIDRNITPKDANWIEGSKYFGRLVSTGIGIDPVLLGDNAAQTYDNYRTALLIAYTTTILPLLDFILSSLNRWLTPKFADGDNRVQLSYDPMQIDALEEANLKKIARIVEAVGGPVLTPDEGRQIIGYDTVNADALLWKFNVQTHRDIFSNVDIDSGVENLQSIRELDDDQMQKELDRILGNTVSTNGQHK